MMKSMDISMIKIKIDDDNFSLTTDIVASLSIELKVSDLSDLKCVTSRRNVLNFSSNV